MIGTLFYTSFVPAPDVLHSAGHLRYTIVDSLKSNLFFFNLKTNLFIYLAVLGLCCCARAFSSCGERGLLFMRCAAFARALGVWASVVVAHGLSCSAACGIFPDQRSNPRPLHWQADS